MSGRKTKTQKKGSVALPSDSTFENSSVQRHSLDDLIKGKLVDDATHPELRKMMLKRNMIDVAVSIINESYEAKESDIDSMNAYQHYIVDNYQDSTQGAEALADDLTNFKEEQHRRNIFASLSSVKDAAGAKAALAKSKS